MSENLYSKVKNFNGKVVILKEDRCSEGRGIVLDGEFYIVNVDEKTEEAEVYLVPFGIKADKEQYESGHWTISKLEEVTPNTIEAEIIQAYEDKKDKIQPILSVTYFAGRKFP